MARERYYDVMSAEDIIRLVTRWIVDVVLVITAAVFLTYMFGTRVKMEGNSMTQTISDKDKLLLNRFSGSVRTIKRYDVLVYRLNDEEGVYLKRVVGLPGETVQIKEGSIYINGERLKNNTLIPDIAYAGVAEKPIELASDEYFVIGENPDGSLDSRYTDVGNIPLDNVLGTVWLRYAPFRNLKKF